MFGSSNSFGQLSCSPFGAQPAFEETKPANTNNSFALKTFGSTSPFGSQTGGSFIGGTATGVFAATHSPSSTPAFGTSSTPAFGTSPVPAFGSTSTPAFGASSTPAFGSTSTTFGTTSPLGLKSAFGGFGSPNPTQSSPFGSTFSQTQPAFGTTSTPAFGASSTPAFGASSTLAFSTFNQTQPAFSTTSTPAFGVSSTTPSFGFGSTSAFGQSSPIFGSGSTHTFEEDEFWKARAQLLDVELLKERTMRSFEQMRLQGQVDALQRERITLRQEINKMRVERDQLQAQVAGVGQDGEVGCLRAQVEELQRRLDVALEEVEREHFRAGFYKRHMLAQGISVPSYFEYSRSQASALRGQKSMCPSSVGQPTRGAQPSAGGYSVHNGEGGGETTGRH